MRELVWLPEASEDVAFAMEYFEGREPGLGFEFLDEVVDTLQPVLSHPYMFAEVAPGIHRAVIQRFSFGAFYAFDEDGVYLIALIHTSRSPDSWPDGM
jgi:hypothetical protein